jgi:hypothetical protein
MGPLPQQLHCDIQQGTERRMKQDLARGLRLGSPTNPTVVALSEFKGHRLLDVRRFYVEKDSKNLLPTKKGISLNAALAKEIKDSLNANWEAIEEWLMSGSSSAYDSVERAMVDRTNAIESESTKARPIEVRNASSKSAEFFAVESAGGIEQLTFNQKHPFFSRIDANGEAFKDSNSPLNLILVAYHRAKLRFAGEIEANAEEFFGLFEHEWGLLLKNYCEHFPSAHDE